MGRTWGEHDECQLAQLIADHQRGAKTGTLEAFKEFRRWLELNLPMAQYDDRQDWVQSALEYAISKKLLDRFDPTVGRPSAYLRAHLRRWFGRAHVVSDPLAEAQALERRAKKIADSRKEYRRQRGTDPTDEEIASATGLDVAEVRETEALNWRVSIDAPSGEGMPPISERIPASARGRLLPPASSDVGREYDPEVDHRLDTLRQRREACREFLSKNAAAMLPLFEARYGRWLFDRQQPDTLEKVARALAAESGTKTSRTTHLYVLEQEMLRMLADAGLLARVDQPTP